MLRLKPSPHGDTPLVSTEPRPNRIRPPSADSSPGSQLDFARPVRSPLRQRPAAIPRRISDVARGCYDVFPAAAGIRILRVDRQPPWKARSRTLAQVNQRLTAPSAERHVQSRD